MYNIMDIKTIFLVVIVIICLILLYRYISKDASKLSGLNVGTTMQEISASELNYPDTSATSNFTYSIWIYVDNWNYRYGEPKMIFGRMMSGSGTSEPCPSVVLGGMKNDLEISMTTYANISNTFNEMADDDIDLNDINNTNVYKCNISNIPIQRWVNILISVYNRTLDVYLDGKLVRTCMLPGVAKIDANAPLFITPNGGFSGWTSKFQYWPYAVDPQKAWSIYSSGYGGSGGLLGNLFGIYGSDRYGVKVAIMKGDMEKSSFVI
jgi:hypothetical protein